MKKEISNKFRLVLVIVAGGFKKNWNDKQTSRVYLPFQIRLAWAWMHINASSFSSWNI